MFCAPGTDRFSTGEALAAAVPAARLHSPRTSRAIRARGLESPYQCRRRADRETGHVVGAPGHRAFPGNMTAAERACIPPGAVIPCPLTRAPSVISRSVGRGDGPRSPRSGVGDFGKEAGEDPHGTCNSIVRGVQDHRARALQRTRRGRLGASSRARAEPGTPAPAPPVRSGAVRTRDVGPQRRAHFTPRLPARTPTRGAFGGSFRGPTRRRPRLRRPRLRPQ